MKKVYEVKTLDQLIDVYLVNGATFFTKEEEINDIFEKYAVEGSTGFVIRGNTLIKLLNLRFTNPLNSEREIIFVIDRTKMGQVIKEASPFAFIILNLLKEERSVDTHIIKKLITNYGGSEKEKDSFINDLYEKDSKEAHVIIKKLFNNYHKSKLRDVSSLLREYGVSEKQNQNFMIDLMKMRKIYKSKYLDVLKFYNFFFNENPPYVEGIPYDSPIYEALMMKAILTENKIENITIRKVMDSVKTVIDETSEDIKC